MGFQWPSSRSEQGTVVILGLLLIPLAFLVASSAKELCVQGEIMWEGQGVGGESGRLYVLRVLCLPKEGPFVGQFALAPEPGAPPAELEWYAADDGAGNERFMHVDGARAAVEGIMGDV